MKKNPNLTGQLDFDAQLRESDTTNRAREFERETAHLRTR
jgi:hypothetical protein